MSAPDELLVSQIAAGDREAFAQFYERYAGRVFALLIRRVGNRAEAEDALQDTFARVWVCASEFDGERGTPLVWLIRIACSRGIDVIRCRPRVPAHGRAAPRQAEDASLVVDRADLINRTERAMEQLSSIQRELLLAAFYGGRTHEQLAQDRGLPLGTVKTHIRRGMQRLRECLLDRYQGEAV